MNNIKFKYQNRIKYLIIINLFFYMISYFFLFNNYYIDNVFALYIPIDERFKMYQIITHMFIHSKIFILHIFFNMISLWIFGRKIEYILGIRKFCIIYFLSGFLGSCLQTLFYLVFSPLNFFKLKIPAEILMNVNKNIINNLYSPMIGSSAAISGIIGTFISFFPNYQIFIIPIPFPIFANKILVIFILLSITLSFFFMRLNIGHFAHIGGIINGYFLGDYYLKKISKN